MSWEGREQELVSFLDSLGRGESPTWTAGWMSRNAAELIWEAVKDGDYPREALVSRVSRYSKRHHGVKVSTRTVDKILGGMWANRGAWAAQYGFTPQGSVPDGR